MTEQKKGFGGFGDLVSDISAEVPSTPQQTESISKAGGATAQAPKPAVQAPPSQSTETLSPPSRPSPESSETNWLPFVWVMGGSIALFIVFVIAASTSGDVLKQRNGEKKEVPISEQPPAPQTLREANLRPGEAFNDCATCPDMVAIPEGQFTMGSHASEKGRHSDEGPLRLVSINAFALGKTEVTQGQWYAVMGNNPSKYSRCGANCPVEQTDWNEVQEFIRKLNNMTGKHYRLPSEAEWEYACRAGGQHTSCGDNKIERIAWYSGNSGDTTHQVGTKARNAFGLYDMAGNVWEWTDGCYDRTGTGCTARVMRGGSWRDDAGSLRAALRYRVPWGNRMNGSGFRLARTLEPAPKSNNAAGIPVPDIDVHAALTVDSMLTTQGNDPKAIEATAAAIDKARKPKLGLDKAAAKESRVQNNLGLKASKAGSDSEAAKHFFAALKLNPYDQEIADNLGFSLYAIADYPAATKAYYVSLALNPRRSSAWIGLAKVLAVTWSSAKALNAFELGFRFTKSPKATRQGMITIFREDKNPVVRSTAGQALANHYSMTVADFIKPFMGNLADVNIPLFLPITISVPQIEGKRVDLFVPNNSEFSIHTGSDFYKIPVASEPDCRGMYCMLGLIAAQKSTRQDLGGESIELHGGIKGRITKGELRAPDQLDFWVGDIRYTFSMGIGVEADIEAANSALKFGGFAADALGSLPKPAATLPATSLPAPPVYSPPAATIPPARQGIALPTPDWTCNITFDIALETFGEGVTVELRFGYPGRSAVVSATESWGGSVGFDHLCPGSYFLAIGNNDSVSVTPVRDFVTDTAYRSTIRMQRGSGNVSSKRRSEL